VSLGDVLNSSILSFGIDSGMSVDSIIVNFPTTHVPL
jgi:hypothetical protein